MFEINRMTARTCSMLGQRGSIFGLAALDAAKEDDKFVLLPADLATLSGMDRYIKTYPDQFILWNVKAVNAFKALDIKVRG